MYETNQHFSTDFILCKILNLPKKEFLEVSDKTAEFDYIGASQKSKFTINSHLHMCNPKKKKSIFSSSLPQCCNPVYEYDKKCKIIKYFQCEYFA